MKVTVKRLIEKLHEFPLEAEIAIEAVEDEQEFYIFNFNSDDNILTIVISGEDFEEKEEETEEG